MTRTGVVFRAARRGRAIARSKLYYGLLWGVLLRSRAKARHRACIASAEHSDSHTYTSFYRSPPQLAALTGPVIDHVTAAGPTEVSILVLAGSNGAEAYTIASELIARRPDLSFSITASDLHEETVAKAVAATYTLDEITQDQDVPAEFIERTFDRAGDAYTVKEHIRSHVTFTQADLLDPALHEQFDQADIVIAQNVLFHMPTELARRAFANIIGFLKPHAVLLIEGMDLDMRVELTRPPGCGRCRPRSSRSTGTHAGTSRPTGGTTTTAASRTSRSRATGRAGTARSSSTTEGKARRNRAFRSVAGAGFEPATFGL